MRRIILLLCSALGAQICFSLTELMTGNQTHIISTDFLLLIFISAWIGDAAWAQRPVVVNLHPNTTNEIPPR